MFRNRQRKVLGWVNQEELRKPVPKSVGSALARERRI